MQFVKSGDSGHSASVHCGNNTLSPGDAQLSLDYDSVIRYSHRGYALIEYIE